MKITISAPGFQEELFSLDVCSDMAIENVKALCEFETGVQAANVVLLWNGNILSDPKKTLMSYEIKEGDVLLLHERRNEHISSRVRPNPAGGNTVPPVPGVPQLDFGAIQVPGTSQGAGLSQAAPVPTNPTLSENPETLRQMLLASPHDLAILKERNPPLAESIKESEKFAHVLRKQQEERNLKERDRIRMLMADPFDADVQQKIAEEIRLKNVDNNMETAMEYAPESFGQVTMLYIDCKVNGNQVKAFVDSGAQMTIMSQACAERCNIMRLVDKRWAGLAKGVGTQKIIGRVHLCQIQIGPDFLQSSFSILEDQPMDMLLGLDMLKRHQCMIDLKNGMLVIGTTGTTTKFLAEGELPVHARLNRDAADEALLDDDHQLAQALSRSGDDCVRGAADGAPTFPEADVQKLVEQGFSRQQVVVELQKTQGNVDQALIALLTKSINVP